MNSRRTVHVEVDAHTRHQGDGTLSIIRDQSVIGNVTVGSTTRVPLRRPALLAAQAVPALVIIGVLSWPLVFAHSYFDGDWLMQLWFMWKQSVLIQADHLPSLFLSYPHGALYPHYAFYGGTLYAITGLLSLVLGNAPLHAYVLTYLLGFAAAYGGWYWIARLVGVERSWAQVPGLIFITSSYYLTLIYARGDWPEFIGISMIPLISGAGLSILRTGRPRLGAAVALAVGGIVFFGSHTLTVIWGTTMFVVVGLMLLVCVPRLRRMITRRGLLGVAGILIPTLLVSAWFLLPAAAYESTTSIASKYPIWRGLLQETMYLVTPSHLFTLSRSTAGMPGGDFVTSLPILVMGWLLLCLPLALRAGLRQTWTRVLLICSAVAIALIILMTHAGLVLALPRVYATIQFTYRLESYILLALSGAVLAVLALGRGEHHRMIAAMRWALLPILAISLVGAIQQTGAFPPTEARDSAFASMYTTPTSQGEQLLDYIDVDQPLVSAGTATRELDFDVAPARGDHLSKVVALQPGTIVQSNLLAPPDLIHVTGASIIGINGETGADVLRIGSITGSDHPYSTRTVSVTAAMSLPVVLGRALTLLGLAALAGQLALLLIKRSRAIR